MDTCPINHDFEKPKRRDFDVSPDATLEFEKDIKTGEYVCVYANQSAHKLFGYASGDLPGIDLRQLIPPSMRKKHSALVDGFKDGNEQSRSMGEQGRLQKAVKEDGSEFDCSISIYQYVDSDGKKIVGAIVNPEGKAAAIIKEQNDRLKTQNSELAKKNQSLELRQLDSRDNTTRYVMWLCGFVILNLLTLALMGKIDDVGQNIQVIYLSTQSGVFGLIAGRALSK